ncbi:Clc-like protein, partial [Ostertagia ostertagi]
MSSGADFARKGSLTFSIILSVIGMGLSIAAILTPSWQVRNDRSFYEFPTEVVNLREYNSIHEHGLWLDCTRHSRDGNHILQRALFRTVMFRYATVTEPLHCVYKFDYDKYSGTFDLEDD